MNNTGDGLVYASGCGIWHALKTEGTFMAVDLTTDERIDVHDDFFWNPGANGFTSD